MRIIPLSWFSFTLALLQYIWAAPARTTIKIPSHLVKKDSSLQDRRRRRTHTRLTSL